MPLPYFLELLFVFRFIASVEGGSINVNFDFLMPEVFARKEVFTFGSHESSVYIFFLLTKNIYI